MKERTILPLSGTRNLEPGKVHAKLTTGCTFSTGICGSLTCSRDGLFCNNGYPINECPDYPCQKLSELRKDIERIRRDTHEKQCTEALRKHGYIDDDGNCTTQNEQIIDHILRSYGHTSRHFNKCVCKNDV